MRFWMKYLTVSATLALFVACSDDDSDFATRPNAKASSSSVSSSSSSDLPQSSSSETSESSSSVLADYVDPSTVVKGTMTDERDGQTYKTVTIGTQTWMAENLNYAYLQPTDELDSSSFCHNDSAESCTKYGRLYLWSAAMDSAGVWSTNGMGCGSGEECFPTYPVRGVCPEGWHFPDSTEWEILFSAVGGFATAGKILKASSGWDSDLEISGNGTDAYGFSALPVGPRSYNGSYHDRADVTIFWTSTKSGEGDAYYMRLWNSLDDAFLSDATTETGAVVRCVKDYISNKPSEL